MSKYKRKKSKAQAHSQVKNTQTNKVDGISVSGKPEQAPRIVQNLAQKRAAHALGIICGATDPDEAGFVIESDESQKKLNSYIAGFAPMILMNGFGQACAFYLANNEIEHRKVYDAVANWLSQSDRPYKGNSDLMNAIVTNDAATYRHAQAEALAYLDWLKKFGKAFLRNELENTNQGGSDVSTTS